MIWAKGALPLGFVDVRPDALGAIYFEAILLQVPAASQTDDEKGVRISLR